jgi:hypothetical protein
MQITIETPQWQEKSREIRKLTNILQWHNNDAHTHNLDGEVLPETCKFRNINKQICIASIKQLNAISHGIFFMWLPHGGGVGIHLPYGKSSLECLSPILSTVTHIYINSLNQKGKYSSFKTLEIRATQSWAANSTNTSKIQKSKIKGAVVVANFFRGSAKINGGT